jgi:hypothetical protein
MNVMISLIELDPKKAVAFGHNLTMFTGII